MVSLVKAFESLKFGPLPSIPSKLDPRAVCESSVTQAPIPKTETPYANQNPDFGRTCALIPCVGFRHLRFGPGPRARALQRPDQRLLTPECDCQRQSMGNAWSMVTRHSRRMEPRIGYRRFCSR